MLKPIERLTTSNGLLRSSVYGECPNDECKNFNIEDEICYPLLCESVDEAVERLSEYEDTGLTPSEVQGIKAKLVIIGIVTAIGLFAKIIMCIRRN